MKKKLLIMAAALMLTLSIGITAFAADTGWKQIDGQWFYYEADGSLASGWEKIGSYWYYFDTDNNFMYYDGMVTVDDVVYCFDEKGHMLSNKWYQDEDGYWYYFEASGAEKYGWLKSGDYWYYLDPDNGGEMCVSNYVFDAGSYYYCDEKGHMVTNTWLKTDGSWRYYKADGKEAVGWEKIGGYWYYFDPDDDADLMVADRFIKIDGVYYHFDEKGHMEANKWINYKDNWLYYKSNGQEATGWEKIGSYWYYFVPERSNAMVENDWALINGKEYRFDEKGHMVTGWFKDPMTNGWCYFESDGTEVSGWKQIGNYWYYFDPVEANEMIADGWLEDKTATYYFDKSGHMVTNCWVNDSDGVWYYYKADGKEASGWYKVGGSWYYFDPADYNAMVCGGTFKIDGKEYTFDADGRWVK